MRIGVCVLHRRSNAATARLMQKQTKRGDAIVSPLRTTNDHRAALVEIESLMAAEPATQDGDRLDMLVSLVEAWEAKHVPVDTSDPIGAQTDCRSRLNRH